MFVYRYVRYALRLLRYHTLDHHLEMIIVFQGAKIAAPDAGRIKGGPVGTKLVIALFAGLIFPIEKDMHINRQAVGVFTMFRAREFAGIVDILHLLRAIEFPA